MTKDQEILITNFMAVTLATLKIGKITRFNSLEYDTALAKFDKILSEFDNVPEDLKAIISEFQLIYSGLQRNNMHIVKYGIKTLQAKYIYNTK